MSENRLSLLIVDDTPANIQVLAGILAAEYRVRIATNGEGALKIAQKDPHPDLILLDVHMPGMSGFDVCRALKADAGTAAIPVVFVTGTADEEDVATGRSLGAEGFLLKPLDPATVIETVKRNIRTAAN